MRCTFLKGSEDDHTGWIYPPMWKEYQHPVFHSKGAEDLEVTSVAGCVQQRTWGAGAGVYLISPVRGSKAQRNWG